MSIIQPAAPPAPLQPALPRALQQALEVVGRAGGNPVPTTSIAEALGISTNAAGERLRRLVLDGFLARAARSRRGRPCFGNAGNVWRPTPRGLAALAAISRPGEKIGMPANPPTAAPPATASESPGNAADSAATLALFKALAGPGGLTVKALAVASGTPQIVIRAAVERLRRSGAIEHAAPPRKGKAMRWRPAPAQQSSTAGAAAPGTGEPAWWLDRFGGTVAVARLLDLSHSTVAQWEGQGIPEHWRQRLAALYDGDGVEADLAASFAALPTGDRLEYWRGSLAIDCCDLSDPVRRRRALAAAAWARDAAADGAAHLVQSRNAPGDTSYLAIKRPAAPPAFAIDPAAAQRRDAALRASR